MGCDQTRTYQNEGKCSSRLDVLPSASLNPKYSLYLTVYVAPVEILKCILNDM